VAWNILHLRFGILHSVSCGLVLQRVTVQEYSDSERSRPVYRPVERTEQKWVASLVSSGEQGKDCGREDYNPWWQRFQLKEPRQRKSKLAC